MGMIERKKRIMMMAKKKSKNLLPITSLNYNYLIAHGGYQSDNTTMCFNVTGLIPGETYTLSCSIDETMASSTQNRLYLRGTSYTFIDLVQATVPVRKSISRVAKEDGTIGVTINVTFSKDPVRCAMITQLQLERGDTMTPYEPY